KITAETYKNMKIAEVQHSRAMKELIQFKNLNLSLGADETSNAFASTIFKLNNRYEKLGITPKDTRKAFAELEKKQQKLQEIQQYQLEVPEVVETNDIIVNDELQSIFNDIETKAKLEKFGKS